VLLINELQRVGRGSLRVFLAWGRIKSSVDLHASTLPLLHCTSAPAGLTGGDGEKKLGGPTGYDEPWAHLFADMDVPTTLLSSLVRRSHIYAVPACPLE
jgi:hypothetical protein